ncbi:transglutaminase-like cysteine peptidase [Rhizobium sp. SG2393]|uniref:transglutaminase-like cysteine peptidase n=1 Tax=Rhizobium sp. SG2393 TaxID=3276279 RepID=UPI00366E9531
MKKAAGVWGLAGAFCAMLMTASHAIPAQAGPSLWMQTGAITSQPIGHYEFCQKYKDECEVKSRSVMPAKVTEHGWAVIREVNDAVNRNITPMTDLELYGKDEVWAYPTTAGDCEDMALLKRKMLLERGFSASDLLMTVVRKPDGEGHAVLTVRTAQGDFILDNLEDKVKLWTDTPYRFLKRQASFHSGRWVTIENGGEVLVGSVGN